MYIGIDLGTTNSAIASFDGSSVTLIPNSRGTETTPSVVRFAEQSVVVGAKAYKHLDTDSLHTHKEFKRLMGTKSLSDKDTYGNQYLPEELSSEVIKSLLDNAEKYHGVRPNAAVVTVPALFELPQSAATAEAARLAGIERVELIPEPVASALASGWNAAEDARPWLVYDLGGGTFDVSLLEARDGLLRIISHDGDNFLGGRDIDRAIVNNVIKEIHEKFGVLLNESDAGHKQAIQHITLEAEQAKIRLSEMSKTSLELDFTIGDSEIETDIALSREMLDLLSEHIVQRTLSICHRLLAQHGLSSEQLGKVVMVGGPANMPIIRDAVEKHIAAIANKGQDPMTLVAQGAALYAATINLQNVVAGEQARASSDACQVWLQYPSVSSDLNPSVFGKILTTDRYKIETVRFNRDDGLWASPEIAVDETFMFTVDVSLIATKMNRFLITLTGDNGTEITADPVSLTIVHGLSMSDPPLARSIGLALADGSTRVFLERGAPLPAKRSFTQHTIETLMPRSNQYLNIPIVQGESKLAKFCRKVGTIVISAKDLDKPLHAGAEILVSIEVDRGANLTSSALIVEHQKLIPAVAELTMVSADPEVLRKNYRRLKQQLAHHQQTAFREKDQTEITYLDNVQKNLQQVSADILQDTLSEDACLRAQRNLIEIEAELEEMESRELLGQLFSQAENEYFNARWIVDSWGNDIEKKMLDDCTTHLRQAFELQRAGELERLIEQMRNLNASAYQRSPQFWSDQFEILVSRVHDASDIKKANKLIEKGKKLKEKGDNSGLSSVVEQLDRLIPKARRAGVETHESGVH